MDEPTPPIDDQELQTFPEMKASPPPPAHLPPVISSPIFVKEGTQVIKTLQAVTARRVYGADIWKDIKSGVRDIVGGRSSTIELMIENMQKEVVTEIKVLAQQGGADALVDLRIQIGEFSGKGKQMFFINAIATPVVLGIVPPDV